MNLTSPAELDAMVGSCAASQDPDYPRFHLAAPTGRLNDPNGLIWRDGRFHTFYQFGPQFPVGKLVHWGHASSTDLVSWQQHEPAIAPDGRYDRSGVYSGGAIEHEGLVWLHYTGNVKLPDGTRESSQCVVTSPDLEIFTKNPANPLIAGPPEGYTTEFRDPQVSRDGDGFRMLLGGQRVDGTGCALIYRSDDLLDWRFDGELLFDDAGLFGSLGFMWECPNLLRIPEEGTGTCRDVLVFCPQGVGPIGEHFRNVFPVAYAVGRLEANRFVDAGPLRELDRGFEFYAPQCFASAPSGGAPIMLGWMGNAGEDDQPSLRDHGWVHTMTVPRSLTLTEDGRIRQRLAAPELDPAAAANAQTLAENLLVSPGGAVELDGLGGERSFVLDLKMAGAAEPWAVELAAGDTGVALRFGDGALTVDRSRTRYAHGDSRTISVRDTSSLRLVHDRSTTELFVDDGLEVFSLRTYLEAAEVRVSVSATGLGQVVLERATAVIIES